VLLLDTHAWIWLVKGDDRLSGRAREAAVRAGHRGLLAVSVISVWEISLLESRGRVILNQPCLAWVRMAFTLSGAQAAPLTPEIAIESNNLPGVFHGDPADRIITATARLEGMTLVTRDREILGYAKNGYVDVLAC
jgi:PIN domain nuclease of toxin-antitoxin system